MLSPDPALATTAAGVLLVLSIIVPVAGVLLAFVLGERYVRLVAFTVMPLGLAMAGGIVLALPRSGGLIVYLLGAWPPPLGVALRADGLSAVMLAIAAIVICAVAVSAATDFSCIGDRRSGALRILDFAAGDLGGVEPHLRRR